MASFISTPAVAAERLRLRARRARRYLDPLLKHGGPRKLANILTVETEMRLRRTVMHGFPYYYFIDICNLCNLRCPLCPTGAGTLERPQRIMSLAEYERILERVKTHALVVSLYNLGESFLNPDIFDIIEHTASQGVGTNLSSNFNWPRPIDPRDIVRSGLEYLTVSIDGVTQESYEKYRVRGNLEEAMGNLRALLDARRALKSRTPVIEWQFIVFKHNEHELQPVRELSAELGVDVLRFVSPTVAPDTMADVAAWSPFMPDNEVFHVQHPDLAARQGYIHAQACSYLYRTMTIDPGGRVTPCCFARKEQDDFGNILTHDLSQVWNNDHYRSARELFSRRAPQPDRVRVMCDTCPVYRQDGAAACAKVTAATAAALTWVSGSGPQPRSRSKAAPSGQRPLG